MPNKKEIVDEICRVAKQLRRTPTKAEFAAQSKISAFFVLQWFDSWNDAVRAAGLRPYAVNARIESRAMLEDWGRSVRRNRGILPRHIYRRRSRYNPCTLAKRFGAWTRVPEAFRKFAKGKREWADVVALLPDTVRRAHVPATKSEPGRSDRSSSTISAMKVQHAPLKDRAMCGNPLEFGVFRNEPVNEQGVVLLFGVLAAELGYRIESVQNGFPDCEAMRQVGTDRWQRVRIEFEFESRNFREHGHSRDGCDVIVCWRHNWAECPAEIEVIELSRIVRSWRHRGVRQAACRHGACRSLQRRSQT